ncbi:AraC family transcriptional regulator [Paenibacillus sp. P96]|uniref:AraC family transcriptional regulator n=1 Tax=Paenibacillus zeirhizosphaerae TaxID=2987519 RepID=A0ABT9FSA4_9BACL|nr:AraC family transcriptional regulator [Paenibacillus sp. P96]MDP4097611.1 AraC family transcriptional regulator [Paenibacillus sp. P96]
MRRETLRENRIHGHPSFPVSVYADVEQLNGNCILDCHWHDEMELILVRKGSALFQTDMLHTEVKAGEALFVNSGMLHAGYLHHDAHCVFSAVVFDPKMLLSRGMDVIQQRFIEPILHKKLLPPVHIKGTESWGKEVLTALQKILQDHETRHPAKEISTKAQLYSIFASMYPYMTTAAGEPPEVSAGLSKVERIKTAIGYIHEHYQEPLRLKAIADEVGMSEGHFCRFFKQMVQKSPIEYMNHYRIQKACLLLEQSDRKVVDIAMEVGFDNLSYFIATFKKWNGMTPSRYRKEHEAFLQSPVISSPAQR